MGPSTAAAVRDRVALGQRQPQRTPCSWAPGRGCRAVPDWYWPSSRAIAGLRQSPKWPRLKTVAHTLAYDDAITRHPTLWTERARPVRGTNARDRQRCEPGHLRDAAQAASSALPNARRPTVPGSFHFPPRSSPPSSPSSSPSRPPHGAAAAVRRVSGGRRTDEAPMRLHPVDRRPA
jgi:hypothetical protein